MSNENLQKLEAGDIESATTELPNLSQSEELTTKDEVQESNTVDLQDQESYFVPDEEISYVIEEIKRSNASNRITMQNIESVQNTTNILGNPVIYDMNLRRFKLLEISQSNKENMRVLTIGMLAVAVALVAAIAAAVPFKCWFCNRKNKSHSSSKEETPSSNLLSAITLESRGNSII
ncbi:MAG: hypothetical protein ACR5LA_08015 [Wolbachia sp.]